MLGGANDQGKAVEIGMAAFEMLASPIGKDTFGGADGGAVDLGPSSSALVEADDGAVLKAVGAKISVSDKGTSRSV